MKTIIVLSILTLFHPLFAISAGKSVVVTVENPADFERTNETIAVPLGDLTQKLKGIEVDQLVVFEAKNGTVLLSQVTENELLFQCDFKPRERKKFVVRQSDEDIAKPQSLVDGRFELPREDYAWENDRIAFRMYGPALAKDVNNGIDVWTKRVRHLVVEKWYRESKAAGKDTYHEDHGEGADFFSVGKSLGAGSSGLWLRDSLYQPGVFSTQRTICNGPIRMTFELTYAKWEFNGRTITERKRISLDAGQNLNRIQVSFDRLIVSDSICIATGLVKRPNTALHPDDKHSWMSLWGPTNNDTLNGFLGTGIVLPPSGSVQFTEDKLQHLMVGRLNDNEPFTYYTGAGWTKSGDFTTGNDWNNYLDNFAQRLQTPLAISTFEE